MQRPGNIPSGLDMLWLLIATVSIISLQQVRAVPFVCEFYKDKNCATFGLDPTCGNDGVTYDNVCFFSKEECHRSSLDVAYPGRCRTTTTSVPATTKAVSVGCSLYSHMNCANVAKRETCGNNGKTYENACYFGKAECQDPTLQVLHLGHCVVTTKAPTTAKVTTTQTTRVTTTSTTTMPTTPTTTMPTTTTTTPTTTTTTTTTTTRPTTLSFLCQAMVAAVCPSNFIGVCGDDQKTYQNPCKFTVQKCHNPGLLKAHDGPCLKTQVNCSADFNEILAVQCSNLQDPLCGSDGNTYGNMCQFMKAKCFVSTLEIVSVGKCQNNK